ncbi:orotidine-5'-phosphate decarboxylase [Cytophagaceae bacterium DM2B3-1]|uniref:Orotidine-5'-phosphate decarboxylase n=1 Tax=Xanthocytophaga flava TaxID=3048013 RepID=A0AAE3QWS9_9BACT|nr:orotidine-5'-phosphate decarboxylase [Xanthocytophaga flavus]MDJ1471950.1 orotidine-5'-phosphate decarboxylase [Xanthocytophaga flavus]MDJ1484660.1 orotidine-5'-phosphate decarboxylase [Xanthocytophaga flavus]MDJ1496887.1 orotidine-5'-phosphate decarboxylase [Xanthocytophaga flavus]
MNKSDLFRHIQQKQSYLCVGLDTDIQKIPSHLQRTSDPIFEFNKQIIDATADYCVAYKPNIAFYEAHGAKGWESLQKTIEYIPKEFFTIADAKRGDIGNTSGLYARAFFEQMNFDSITVAPYMGKDSVEPFLAFEDKWVILLALTSNTGSHDFQTLPLKSSQPLFEQVIETSQKWAGADKMMYVIGATQAEQLGRIRQLVPGHFLLVPGVGAQGGDLEEVSRIGLNKECGLLINSSRSILYASSGEDFARQAATEAQKLQQQMATMLEKYC